TRLAVHLGHPRHHAPVGNHFVSVRIGSGAGLCHYPVHRSGRVHFHSLRRHPSGVRLSALAAAIEDRQYLGGEPAMMELIPPNTKIDFVRYRNIAMMISWVLIVIGIGTMFLRGGPNYGIDFAGGALVQVRFTQPTRVDDVRAALEKTGLGNDSIQDMG